MCTLSSSLTDHIGHWDKAISRLCTQINLLGQVGHHLSMAERSITAGSLLEATGSIHDYYWEPCVVQHSGQNFCFLLTLLLKHGEHMMARFANWPASVSVVFLSLRSCFTAVMFRRVHVSLRSCFAAACVFHCGLVSARQVSFSCSVFQFMKGLLWGWFDHGH